MSNTVVFDTLTQSGRAKLVMDFSRELMAALRWAEQLGIKVASSRFEHYLQVFRASAGASAEDLARTGSLDELVNAAFESAELIDIARLSHTHFRDHADALNKVRSALGGRKYQSDYQPTERDRNRDDAFELSVAAELDKFGLFGGGAVTGGDLLMAHDMQLWPVECKRLTPPTGFENSVKDGRKRLKLKSSALELKESPPTQRLARNG